MGRDVGMKVASDNLEVVWDNDTVGNCQIVINMKCVAGWTGRSEPCFLPILLLSLII